MKKLLFSLVLFFIFSCSTDNTSFINSTLSESKKYKSIITRDIWGVPHIQGERDADVAFGLAYAHAEDDIKNIAENMDLYRAQMGLKIGYEGATSDYLIKTLRIREMINENYLSDLSVGVRNILEAYATGLNYWGSLNPDNHYIKYFPFTKEDIVAGFAIQNLFFSGVVNSIKKLENESSSKDQERSARDSILEWESLVLGSNAFAISPVKSDDGTTRLMINSHQPLDGPLAWYEAHLQSEEGWNMMGGLFPGSPFIFVGFNENIGWGLTVNKPDLSDIFLLSINPDNSNQYLLDDNWVNFTTRIIELPIKLFGPFYWTFKREVHYSVHGPILETKNGVYAIRYAGMSDIKQVDQWYKLNKSNNLEEWLNAMKLRSIISFNAIYADAKSNILFLHNSSSPLRNESINWINPVDGSVSDLIWNETVPFEDLPLIINPESGWLASTNQDPFKVTSKKSNLDPKNYSQTLGLQTRMTNRANRVIELFNKNKTVSAKLFEDIKYDNQYSKDSRAYQYLNNILKAKFETKELIEAQTLLKNWNLKTNLMNRSAPLGVCIISYEWIAEQENEEVIDPIKAFKTCVKEIKDIYHRIDPLWSERNFIVRGDRKIPVQGGPDTLRAIYGIQQDDGSLKASGGDGLYIFLEWDKNQTIKAKSIHQYGSSTQNKTSRHFDDQMDLYAKEEMKDTFFKTFKLKKNIETVTKVPFE